jgi:hypothetical protein
MTRDDEWNNKQLRGDPEFLTMQAIRAEVIRSRIVTPGDDRIHKELEGSFRGLTSALVAYEENPDDFPRDDVEMMAIRLAAMAIRFLEEGSGGTTFRGVSQKWHSR